MKRLLSAVWIGTFLLISLIPFSARGQAHGPEVGLVIVAVGQFSAIKPSGETRTLQRRSAIYNGDTLVTGPDAKAQIRFSDGSLIALRPASQFRVDNFSFDGSADGDENAAFTLLKGGMRTITGVIGKQNKEKYQVRTDVATIGVRGTHYVLHTCAGNCGSGGTGLYGGVIRGAIVVTNEGGSAVIGQEQFFHVSNAGTGPQLLLTPPDLLFSGEEQDTGDSSEEGSDGDGAGQQSEDAGQQSESGSTDDGNDTTGTNAGSGQQQATGGSEPVDDTTASSGFQSDTQVDAPPATLTTSTGTTSPTTPIDVTLDTGTDIVETDPGTVEPPPVEPTLPSAPNGAVMGVAFISVQAPGDYKGDGGSFRQGEGTADGTTDIKLDTVGTESNIPVKAAVFLPDHTEVIGGVTEIVPGCSPCTLEIGTATLVDTGGLAGAGMGLNWGRWEGDYVVTDNGQVMTPVGGLHYIYSPNETPYSTVSSMTGTFYYDFAGGTAPTDEQGVAGTLTGAYLSIDFNTQTVSSASLYGDVNGKSFTAYSENMVSLSSLYSTDRGIGLVGNCYGGACGAMTSLHGNMSLNLVGPNAERAISAYGLQQDGVGPSGVAISGAVAFEQAPALY